MMPTDFSPSAGRETAKPPEPRRFVPTLTEVVHMPAQPVGQAHLKDEPMPCASPIAVKPAAGVDTQALVARVCATVNQGLDDHLRALVADAMEAQHMLLVQSLRGQLTPLIENLVRDALAGETVHAARQAGESCIQATD